MDSAVLDIIHNIVFAAHMLGLAAVVGVFIVQMRAKDNFRTGLLLGGAITQLVSGILLVGLIEMGDDHVNNAKVAVKLSIAAIVLIAAIVAMVQQRKGKLTQPAFHTAGGLAVVNVLVATLWH